VEQLHADAARDRLLIGREKEADVLYRIPAPNEAMVVSGQGEQ